MASVNIYLNFQGNCEAAFNHYKSVFGGEFSAPMAKMGDMPPAPGMPELSEADKKAVMHVGLPILDGTILMGTDMLESMGHKLVIGNNTTISLTLDSKEQADKLYHALTSGNECVAPHDEFWGYWGVCLDNFGIRWMFNVPSEQYK